MASPKIGLALGAVGILAVVLGLKTAKAKPGGGGGPAPEPEPSESDKTGYAEGRTLQGFIEKAAGYIVKNDAAGAKGVSHQIKTYPWTHPEIKAAAWNEAANIDDAVKDIEDYNKAVQASKSNKKEADYPIDPQDLLNHLGG